MTHQKIKNFISTFGVFGSLASIIALIIIFIPKSNTLELSATTSLIENLTDYQLNDPDLKAKYFYKGDTIANLWKAVIEFENKSEETFVISDKLRNIIVDSLEFNMSEGVIMIDKKTISEDFPNNTKITDGGKSLCLNFEQWRPGEKLKMFIYFQVKDTVNVKDNIFIASENRPIVNGDIKYFYENGNEKVETNNYSFIPSQVRKVAYVLMIIGLGLVEVLFIIAMISSVIGYYRRKDWRRSELLKFNQFIIKYYKDSKEERDSFLNNPRYFYLWSKYDGEEYPELDIEYNVEKGISLFFAELFTLIGLVSITIIIIDLILLFP